MTPLLRSCRDNMLHRLLRTLGEYLGAQPKFCLLSCLLIFVISLFGWSRMSLHQDLKQGYSLSSAPSNAEYRALQRYFDNPGPPYYMGLFAQAKDGGSMMRNRYFHEFKSVYDHITKKLNITINNQSLTYDDLCGQFCEFNSLFWKIMDARNYYGIDLQYPVTRAFGHVANIGRYFFGCHYDRYGNLAGADTLALWFHTFESNGTTSVALKTWELAVLDYIVNYNATHIQLIQHGSNVLAKEVVRGTKSVAPLYLMGLIVTMIWTLLCMLCIASHYAQLNWKTPFLGVLTVLSPLFSSFSALGIVLLVGCHLNMITVLSPFLVFSIGISADGSFLLASSWFRLDRFSTASHSASKRLGLVFSEHGPSLVLVSFTEFLAFALGAIVPVPEIRRFCTIIATIAVFQLLFQLLFFIPCLVLLTDDHDEKVHISDKKTKTTSARLIKSFIDSYCRFITSWLARILAFVLLGIYLLGAVSGVYRLKSDLNPSHLILPSSQSRIAMNIMEDRIWPSYQSALLIVQKPPDFSNAIAYQQFLLAVDDFESLPLSLTEDATQYWTKDYVRFLTEDSEGGVFAALFNDEEDEHAKEQQAVDGLKNVDLSRFTEFISTSPYDNWKKGVHYREINGSVHIDSFLLMPAYGNISSFGDKARLIEMWRMTADRHAQFDIRLWDSDSQISDVILNIRPTVLRTAVITIVIMGVVYLLFVPNLATVACAVSTMASIDIGVFGYMHWWNGMLDPINMASFIIGFGLSVDFSVHIACQYQSGWSFISESATPSCIRLARTVRSSALPLLISSTSCTLLLLPVLLTSQVLVFSTISRVIFLTSLFGLMHGLFLLPVLLTTLPHSLIGQRFFYTPVEQRQEAADEQ